METTYGYGEYTEGAKRISGVIVADEHKLFMRSAAGDEVGTYIPLEKIARVQRRLSGMRVVVRLSAATGYTARISGEWRHISALIRDLTARLNLKKQLFFPEWIGEVSWR